MKPAPTLEDYEELAGVEIDLSEHDIDRETINAELERLYEA
ncbi:hypothetical protein [Halovivax cerinus]|uniref:Uncharacterized protein n=1 Tax=Halovivax cerinus TaxID=1487865 RepID=A0ABD5NSW5_9EURY|nr:hypothetical protein [Halovivax cerinus]